MQIKETFTKYRKDLRVQLVALSLWGALAYAAASSPAGLKFLTPLANFFDNFQNVPQHTQAALENYLENLPEMPDFIPVPPAWAAAYLTDREVTINPLYFPGVDVSDPSQPLVLNVLIKNTLPDNYVFRGSIQKGDFESAARAFFDEFNTAPTGRLIINYVEEGFTGGPYLTVEAYSADDGRGGHAGQWGIHVNFLGIAAPVDIDSVLRHEFEHEILGLLHPSLLPDAVDKGYVAQIKSGGYPDRYGWGILDRVLIDRNFYPGGRNTEDSVVSLTVDRAAIHYLRDDGGNDILIVEPPPAGYAQHLHTLSFHPGYAGRIGAAMVYLPEGTAFEQVWLPKGYFSVLLGAGTVPRNLHVGDGGSYTFYALSPEEMGHTTLHPAQGSRTSLTFLFAPEELEGLVFRPGTAGEGRMVLESPGGGSVVFERFAGAMEIVFDLGRPDIPVHGVSFDVAMPVNSVISRLEAARQALLNSLQPMQIAQAGGVGATAWRRG